MILDFLKSSKFYAALSIILILLTMFVTGYRKLNAGNNDVCLSCHDDKDLYSEKDGKKKSLFVSSDIFKKSVHGSGECTDCHVKYNPDEVPHSKTGNKVDCKSCHDDLKGIEQSVHSGVNCYDCHTKHSITPAKDMAKDQTKNCLGCHTSKNVQAYSMSIHSKKNVGCESCHTGGHTVKKIPKDQVASTCGKCHGEHQKNFSNSIHQTVLKSGNNNAPTCTDCHGSHQITSSKMSIESQSCLKCHLDDKKFPGTGKGSAKFVQEYRTSVHASIEKNGSEAAGCTDCHGNHNIQDPQNPKASTMKTRSPETCGKCHPDIVNKYYNSAHGQALKNKIIAAPTCVDCHSEHSIKAVKKSDEFSKVNQVEMCLNCHVNGKLPHKNYKGEEVLISNYKDSYHYAALQKGNLNAATCSDCHGAHEMKKADDLQSSVNKKNIEKTCGQANCHVKQFNEYKGSIHEVSVSTKDNSDAPTCTNCHGMHQILKKDEKDNRISNPKGLVQLCSDCHNSVTLIAKYNLPSGRTDSYMNTFHGLATREGSKVVANCESCHGNHSIRPSSDTLSTINKKNLASTCGKCHPGTNEALLNSPVHIVKEADSPMLFVISKFYLVFIVLVIGGMILHNTIDFSKKFRKKNNKPAGKDG
ncbi:MAG: cytochrome c3 family protein [Ignavibacteria bacterium]